MPGHYPFKDCWAQHYLHLTLIYLGPVPSDDKILDYMDNLFGFMRSFLINVSSCARCRKHFSVSDTNMMQLWSLSLSVLGFHIPLIGVGFALFYLSNYHLCSFSSISLLLTTGLEGFFLEVFMSRMDFSSVFPAHISNNPVSFSLNFSILPGAHSTS